MELFRRKTLVHLRQRLWGNVLIASPPSTGVVSLVISMLLAVIAAYLHLGEYSLLVFGNAELAPLDGIAKIYSPKVSTVSVVFVKGGDAAIKGDKLCHNRTR